MKKLTFNDFLAEVRRLRQTYPGLHQREGQAFMNALWRLGRHDLYDDLRVSEVDPFYVDKNLPEALTFVGLHWDDEV